MFRSAALRGKQLQLVSGGYLGSCRWLGAGRAGPGAAGGSLSRGRTLAGDRPGSLAQGGPDKLQETGRISLVTGATGRWVHGVSKDTGAMGHMISIMKCIGLVG